VTGRVTRRRELVLAWAVVGLGFAVLSFHAAALPYFWMTLGTFPAAAGAIALGPIAELLPTPRITRLVVGALWCGLAIGIVPITLETLRGDQAVQRDALAFVARDFPAAARGFHPERAIFCRRDPAPFGVYFTQQIHTRLNTGPDAADNAARFVAEFRSRPISFIVESYRLAQFPDPVRAFWNSHYVLYADAVYVAGVRHQGPAGRRGTIDVIVPGRYRWNADVGDLVVDEATTLAPGDELDLAVGVHALRAATGIHEGILTLALPDPPDVRPRSFYGSPMIRQLRGRP
jgi:hypothetical protein